MSQSGSLRDFMRSEFIGRDVKVLDKRGEEIASGCVTWETRNMIHVGDPPKKFEKRTHRFLFLTEEGEIVVDGSRIVFRPEERIKRLR
ncbi:MAG: ribonuclease P protein subunit [Methanomassiliicoccales archaeon]